MKKVISFLMSIILIISVFSFNALAITETKTHLENKDITYFENGSYIITTIVEDTTLTRATNTKSGQKTSSYYNSDDEIQWSAVLKGTFTYNGSSSTCTTSNITYTTYVSNWKIPSATATKNSNKAIGNVTAKRYLLGIPVQTIEKTITLTCSATGTLS